LSPSSVNINQRGGEQSMKASLLKAGMNRRTKNIDQLKDVKLF
jgi:hypothetical protein